jgi:hypothetical protein
LRPGSKEPGRIFLSSVAFELMLSLQMRLRSSVPFAKNAGPARPSSGVQKSCSSPESLMRVLCLGIALMLLISARAAAQPSSGPSPAAPPGAALVEAPSLSGEPLPDTALPEVLPTPESAQEPTEWYQPGHWLVPAPWDSAIELGLNGSSGTNDSLSIRTGGYTSRESEYSKLKMSSYYNRTTSGGDTTQNNANLDIRNDWLLDEHSPWMLYGTTNVFYDEFQAFDLQTNANTGVGYRVFHDPELELIGRLGAGASREIGGPDDRWVPESLVGFEFNQRISLTQKFYGKLDYFPEWDQIGEYRLVADMGWEIALVEPSNLSLKLSASDRFDSTPNGAEPHLVNYSVLLLMRL